MSAFDSHDDDVRSSEDDCQKCGEITVTRCCGGCGGDGYHDAYDEDPLWYNPGDTKLCDDCRGHGFHHWCQNCGWDLIEKCYINGTARIYFPTRWTSDQQILWLAAHPGLKAYPLNETQYYVP